MRERLDDNMNVIPVEGEFVPHEETQSPFDPKELVGIQRIQEMRMRMLNELAADGKTPGDKEDRAFLLSLMKGYEESAANRAKIKVAQGIEQGITDLHEAVGEALLRHRVEKPEEAPAELRVLPSSITPTQMVPGLTDVGTQVLDFRQILDTEVTD